MRFKTNDLALARKLLPVAQRYEAALAEADRKGGRSEWERQEDEASYRVCRLCDRILETTATTAAGVALQARVFKTWIEPDWWSPEGQETGVAEQSVARAMDRLTALQHQSPV